MTYFLKKEVNNFDTDSNNWKVVAYNFLKNVFC